MKLISNSYQTHESESFSESYSEKKRINSFLHKGAIRHFMLAGDKTMSLEIVSTYENKSSTRNFAF